MSKERIQHLLKLYAANQASREEVEELFEWLNRQEGQDALKKFIFDSANKEEHTTTLLPGDWDRIWHSVESATIKKAPAKIVRPFWPRIAAAAVLVVAAGIGWLYFSRPKTNSAPVVSTTVTTKKDISPGGNKAILTLADNSTIVLDSAANGQLAQQGKTSIIKLKDGQLTYAVSNSLPIPMHREGGSGGVFYNTLATPRGGQYQLVLPDGTKVWLNAGSSLTYPVAFTGNERRVEITGEAYFEVKPLTPKGERGKMPFVVKIVTAKGERGEVRVLGTHFNVNAYDNEPMVKTTLLDGSVKVVKRSRKAGANGNRNHDGYHEVILKPGEQVSISHSSQLSRPIPVKTEGAVAWKNGYFRFKETGIRELMRQVERWYDVEVEYKTDRTDQVYTGVVSRSQNISALLKTLELTGTVHFQIDNSTAHGKKGKIIVLP